MHYYKMLEKHTVTVINPDGSEWQGLLIEVDDESFLVEYTSRTYGGKKFRERRRYPAETYDLKPFDPITTKLIISEYEG